MPPNNIQIKPVTAGPTSVGTYPKASLFARRLAICAGLITTVTVLIYAVWLVFPRTVQFAYSADSCITQPVILPGALKARNPHYAPRTTGGVSMAGIPLITTKLCVNPASAPAENTKKSFALKLFGVVPIKRVTVASTDFPSVNLSVFQQPIPPSRPTELTLNNEDAVFSYRLHVNERPVHCDVSKQHLECPIEQLSLVPGSLNATTLERTFKGEHVETIFKGDVRTLDPLNIIGGNAVQSNTILDQPSVLEVVFDKPLADTTTPKLSIKSGDSFSEVAASYEIQDTKLLIKPTDPLTRRSTYLMTIDQASSTSGNTLLTAYRAEFAVSGGPKVVGHNTGTYAFEPSKSIIVRFNQALNGSDTFASKVKVSGANIPGLRITANGSSMIINPDRDLPSCTTITIQIENTILNAYGVSGDSAWKHSFRTLCRRSSAIGTSTQGRSILAHWFGSGPSIILFVGGIHGNEKSSVLTMESWLDELERYAERIPAGRTIVVITTASPDGYVSNSRFNARGVDLNRNFPTANWSSTVSGPGYTNRVNGGGTSPLSEPEAAALTTFVQKYRPRAVLSFHSAAGLVSPNYAGDSDAIAHLYVSKTPYAYANSDQTDIALGYSTTGDFEFWLRDIGIPNILIEHTSLARNEFVKNRDALWAMVGL